MVVGTVVSKDKVVRMRHNVERILCIAPHYGLHDLGQRNQMTLMEYCSRHFQSFILFLSSCPSNPLYCKLHLSEMVLLKFLEVVVSREHYLLAIVTHSERVACHRHILQNTLIADLGPRPCQKVFGEGHARHHFCLARVVYRGDKDPLGLLFKAGKVIVLGDLGQGFEVLSKRLIWHLVQDVL